MKTTELIDEIFKSKSLFEKKVLNVNSDHDRSEIMHILSKLIVRDILKEHLNFLYIQNLSYFTLKHIVNILFKEIANEWISYAIDILELSKDKALDELQKKDRIKFIHKISTDYYKHYKSYIFEEIADTFIELLASITQDSEKTKLVNAIINSKLIANRTVLGINNFDQLYRRVKAAKNSKSAEVSSIQMKISDILTEIEDIKTSSKKRENLFIVLPKYEKKALQINNKKLENFDASLDRVKRAIFNSLKNEVFTS